MPKASVHVLYENPSWLPPLEAALDACGLPCELHDLAGGSLDPSLPPPDGVFWNRMSPSAHTRGHGASIGLMREWLYWLESWGRPVINGSRSFELEVSKFRQDRALRRAGIRTPRTVLAVGEDAIRAAASTFRGPFITKHNQGGKGLGIELYAGPDRFLEWLGTGAFQPGPNDQVILQQFIESPDGHITRVELAGGRFLYAMCSSTAGGFELCPADACQVPASHPDVCPADASEGSSSAAGAERFVPADLDADDPLVGQYLRFCADEGFDIAGIEFVTGYDGLRYTYDVNGNTNYNSGVGAKVGVDGMLECARWIRARAEAGLWAL